MDIDNVDFTKEPFDCAILPGNGHFGTGTRSLRLFDEWLIPIYAPGMLGRMKAIFWSGRIIPRDAIISKKLHNSCFRIFLAVYQNI